MKECFFAYPESYPITVSRIIGAIYGIYCPVIITVNVALIVSFFSTKQPMNNTSNLLIVCLSISDCLIGAIVMPMQFIRSLWFSSEIYCSIVRVSLPLQFLFGGISFFMTMLLAMDRYIHMNPNVLQNDSKIAKLFKRPRIYILIFALCAFFIAISLSLYFLMNINPKIMAYFLAFSTIFLIVMMPIFVIIYTRSYLKIRRFVAENQVYQSRRDSGSNESPEYLKELFKTVLLLVIATMISYLPFIALTLSATILGFINQNNIFSTEYLIIAHTAHFLLYANSFMNALIILYRNEKSRKWLKDHLHLCCKQQNKEGEQRGP